MPITKVGLNLTNLNITAPSFDFKNSSKDLINDLPIKANEITGGWWGVISLTVLFGFLMWKLNQDQSLGGDYGYSSMRSLSISACICSIIGLYALNLGYFANFYHVSIFILVAFISLGAVWKSQN